MNKFDLHNQDTKTLLAMEEAAIQRKTKSNIQVCVGANQSTHFTIQLLPGYSSHWKIKRIIGIALRFKTILKLHSTNRISSRIDTNEIENSNCCILRTLQIASFAEEIKSLRKIGSVNSSCKKAEFIPFSDSLGRFNAGGRKTNSLLPYHTKHSVLLPSNRRYTFLFFEQKHLRLLHVDLIRFFLT